MTESDIGGSYWRFCIKLSLILKAFTRDCVNYLADSDARGIYWRFCKISTAVMKVIEKQ